MRAPTSSRARHAHVQRRPSPRGTPTPDEFARPRRSEPASFVGVCECSSLVALPMVGAAPLEVSLAVEGLELDVARPVGDHPVPVTALRQQPIDVPIGLEVARIEPKSPTRSPRARGLGRSFREDRRGHASTAPRRWREIAGSPRCSARWRRPRPSSSPGAGTPGVPLCRSAAAGSARVYRSSDRARRAFENRVPHAAGVESVGQGDRRARGGQSAAFLRPARRVSSRSRRRSAPAGD